MDKKTRVILSATLALSGKYDLPGQTVTIRGFDAYGQPVEETGPATDWERLDRDVEAAWAARKPYAP